MQKTLKHTVQANSDAGRSGKLMRTTDEKNKTEQAGLTEIQ